MIPITHCYVRDPGDSANHKLPKIYQYSYYFLKRMVVNISKSAVIFFFKVHTDRYFFMTKIPGCLWSIPISIYVWEILNRYDKSNLFYTFSLWYYLQFNARHLRRNKCEWRMKRRFFHLLNCLMTTLSYPKVTLEITTLWRGPWGSDQLPSACFSSRDPRRERNGASLPRYKQQIDSQNHFEEGQENTK